MIFIDRNGRTLTIMYFSIVYASLFAVQVSGFCPNHCQCNDVELIVRCVHASLDVVPILLNPGTKYLDLSHNIINGILPGFGFYHELQFLNLSFNEIKSLGKKNFAVQAYLKNLIVTGNKISHIQDRTFDGLKYLNKMDLSDNFVDVIDENAFISLENLIYLDLSGNRISNLTKEIFYNLTSLRYLNLCRNNLRELSPGVFDYLTNLEELSLCSNALKSLAHSIFKKMGNLVHLSLHNNLISNLSPNAFTGLNILKHLNIQGNLLEEIPSNSLSTLLQLETLHLGGNSYVVASAGAFRDLGNLKNLHISSCGNLASVESNVFESLRKLTHLDLSFNEKLETLHKDVLKPLVNLRDLRLKGNSLRTLDRNLFMWLSLEYLDLSDNNFDCNCSLKWLQELEMNKTASLKVEDVYCSSPVKSKGRNIIELSDYDLECYSKLFLIAACIAPIVLIFLIFIISGFIYYKHCRKMKTLVHDNWPEKIVATWRDPEYEKQLEEEEYTFQTARSVSHIQIPVI